jgi:hypothetical protein
MQSCEHNFDDQLADMHVIIVSEVIHLNPE